MCLIILENTAVLYFLSESAVGFAKISVTLVNTD